MARPAMRTPGGRWSLQQVYTEAGVTLAQTRTVVQKGYLEPDALTEDDVVMLRVAAGLLRAPRPTVPGRTVTPQAVRARDQRALEYARQAVDARWGADSLMLAVFADDVVLATTTGRLNVAIEEHPGQTVLTMPIGQWISALPTPLLDAAAG